MRSVGLDPVAAPLVARSLDDAALELKLRSVRVAGLLAEASEAVLAPSTMRAVAGALSAQAEEIRRRTAAVLDDLDGFVAEVWGFLGGDVLSLWNGGPDDDMPWGRWLAGAVKQVGMAKFLRNGGYLARGNPLPLFNAGAIGSKLIEVRGMAWLGSTPATLALKRAGIAGGLYTGVSGTVGLVGQGNPVNAYQREGAGYVADVAGTAFGYSSAAFLIAPNPVTGAVVIGTGVVWLGAEAWDHRDEIVAAWDTTSGWTVTRLDDAGQWTADRIIGGGRWAGDQLSDAVRRAQDLTVAAEQLATVGLDRVGDLAAAVSADVDQMVTSTLNRARALAAGASQAANDTVGRAGNVAAGFGRATGGALDQAGDVTGDVVGGLGNAAANLVDGAGEAAAGLLGRLRG